MKKKLITFLLANFFLSFSLLAQDLNRNTNTAVGVGAAASLTIGKHNTFTGTQSGRNTTSGNLNTFNGAISGFSNTSGIQNTFMGAYSGFSNTSGTSNTFLGNSSGRGNTTGVSNTFTGNTAGFSNQITHGNTFTGTGSGYSHISGHYNTFTGNEAGKNANGNYNTLIGRRAGNGAFFNADYNTFLGHESGTNNSNGYQNTFIGTSAGNQNFTGYCNTMLGNNANVTSGGLYNATAIGCGTQVSSNNTIELGNTGVTLIQSNNPLAVWVTTSDKRYKKSISDTKNGLNFILALKPKSYQYDMEKVVKENYKELLKETDPERRNQIQKEYNHALSLASKQSKIMVTGLLAQEVEQAMAQTDFENFNGLIRPEDHGNRYGLSYTSFVVPLISAVKEQQKQIESKDKQIIDLQNALKDLTKTVNQIKNDINTICDKGCAGLTGLGNSPAEIKEVPAYLRTAWLGQNFPNPHSGRTSIKYYVPVDAKTAELRVVDLQGKLVIKHKLDISAGSVELEDANLANGMYLYSLIVDHIQIDSKRMAIEK